LHEKNHWRKQKVAYKAVQKLWSGFANGDNAISPNPLFDFFNESEQNLMHVCQHQTWIATIL